MGRGILEYGHPRTERVELAALTNDPTSRHAGEAWLRTDQTDVANDKLAEFRFYDGSTVQSVNVVAPGSTDASVEEVLRVATPNGVGVIPTMTRGDAPHPEMSVQHGGTQLGLGQPSAIPDSEADQKLVHRWLLGETDPFVDRIGGADATNNGTSQVTGDWIDGAARSGDGAGDYIDLTSLGSFGSNMSDADGFAIAVSFQGSSGLASNQSNVLLGTANDNPTTYLQIPLGSDSGGEIAVRDDNSDGSSLSWSSASTYEDNNPHRIVYNVPDVGDVSTWEIYADQGPESVSVTTDSGVSNFSNFQYALYAFARNLRGTADSYTNCILDDVCIFGESLTSTEAQSYTNPWP